MPSSRRNIIEDDILHNHRRENPKSHVAFIRAMLEYASVAQE
jgi:hypothetical protein